MSNFILASLQEEKMRRPFTYQPAQTHKNLLFINLIYITESMFFNQILLIIQSIDDIFLTS